MLPTEMSYQSYSQNLAKSHHESTTEGPLLTVSKAVIFNRAIHIILGKLVTDWLKKIIKTQPF